MTEQELLDLVRRESKAASGPEARKSTAARCRACFAENPGHLEACLRCGRPLVRAEAGRDVPVAEKATDAPAAFVVFVSGERRALLHQGERLVVGRGQSCDVWLEASTVSRSHAELVWDEGAARPRFRDLGSANGTRMNGRLRGQAELEPGWVLEVGPYKITIGAQPVREPAPEPKDERTAVLDLDAEPEFQGLLSQGVASLVLRALALAERTGTFEVALARGTGSVVLADGRIAQVRCGRTVGLAALHVILSSESGAYRFRGSFELDASPEVDLAVDDALAAVPA